MVYKLADIDPDNKDTFVHLTVKQTSNDAITISSAYTAFRVMLDGDELVAMTDDNQEIFRSKTIISETEGGFHIPW